MREASAPAVVAIGQVVQKQAFILAFSDTFYLLGAALIVALMAALLLKKPDHLDSRRRPLGLSTQPQPKGERP